MLLCLLHTTCLKEVLMFELSRKKDAKIHGIKYHWVSQNIKFCEPFKVGNLSDSGSHRDLFGKFSPIPDFCNEAAKVRDGREFA